MIIYTDDTEKKAYLYSLHWSWKSCILEIRDILRGNVVHAVGIRSKDNMLYYDSVKEFSCAQRWKICLVMKEESSEEEGTALFSQ